MSQKQATSNIRQERDQAIFWVASAEGKRSPLPGERTAKQIAELRRYIAHLSLEYASKWAEIAELEKE